MIFDTDVIIWAQRGKTKAAMIIDSDPSRKISILSYMEFIQFAPDKKTLMLSKSFFSTFGFEILPVTPNISHRAATYIEQYSLSHGLEIRDALIAATAFEYGLAFATANFKDYKMIEGLEIVKFHVD